MKNDQSLLNSFGGKLQLAVTFPTRIILICNFKVRFTRLRSNRQNLPASKANPPIRCRTSQGMNAPITHALRSHTENFISHIQIFRSASVTKP
jgi:hypothetical protein